MDIHAYLDRIGYRGALEPTAETLRALQVANGTAPPPADPLLPGDAGRRLSLSGMKPITSRGGERHERVLESEEEHAALLRELFGVVV